VPSELAGLLLGSSQTVTSTTSSAPSVDPHILGRVSMAFRTMGLGGIQRHYRDSAMNVYPMSNMFKVVRPDTGTVPAQVIWFKPWWRRTLQVVVGRNNLALNVELPVATRTNRTEPNSASVSAAGIDLTPVPFFGRLLLKNGSTVPTNTEVMNLAPAKPQAGTRAIRSVTLREHLEPPIPGVTRPDADTSRPLPILAETSSCYAA
jgi:hypothetical protein